jgi:hypothetical protein
VVDIVVLKGDLVALADEEEGPVVSVVAAGAPAGVAVDLSVRNRDAIRGSIARDDVLAADEGGLHVVDPDLASGSDDGNGISSPDVLRVELRDVNVLDDDVLSSVGDTETLATNDS